MGEAMKGLLKRSVSGTAPVAASASEDLAFEATPDNTHADGAADEEEGPVVEAGAEEPQSPVAAPVVHDEPGDIAASSGNGIGEGNDEQPQTQAKSQTSKQPAEPSLIPNTAPLSNEVAPSPEVPAKDGEPGLVDLKKGTAEPVAKTEPKPVPESSATDKPKKVERTKEDIPKDDAPKDDVSTEGDKAEAAPAAPEKNRIDACAPDE
jgi:hypothetical protein